MIDSLPLSHSSPRSRASRRKGTWPGPGPLPCTPSCRLGRTHAGRMTSLGPPGGHDTPHMCLATDPLPLLPAASSELLLPLGLRQSGPPDRGGPQPATDAHTVRHVQEHAQHEIHSLHQTHTDTDKTHTHTRAHTHTHTHMCTACGPQPTSDTCTACPACSQKPSRNTHTVRHMHSAQSICLTACLNSWTHAQRVMPGQGQTYVQSDTCTACTACISRLVCTAGHLHSVYSAQSTACNRCL